jgi:prevent-host-death family protein
MSVGVFEAKTTLSALLERVEAGEEIVITRRGVPVARLVPPAVDGLGDALATLAAARARGNPGSESLRDLIEEGRDR